MLPAICKEKVVDYMDGGFFYLKYVVDVGIMRGVVGRLVFLMKKTLSVLLLLCLGVVQAETFWLEGVDRYSGWSDFNKKDPEAEDGDNNLCWAASVSNVINWWQNRYVTPDDVPTGEDIWTTFKQSTSGDVAGHAIGAMQWWLTGWYSYDGSADAARYAGFAMANEAILNGRFTRKTDLRVITGTWRRIWSQNTLIRGLIISLILCLQRMWVSMLVMKRVNTLP